MAYPTTIQGDLSVNGQISAKTLAIPNGTIDDDAVASGSAGDFIAASKLTHRVALSVNQKTGTDVVAETRTVHVTKGAATAIALYVVCDAKPSTDKTVTVDVKKSTGGAAFATLLTGVVTVSSASTIRVPQSGTFASTAIAGGDVLQIVVAVTSGTGGDQAQGLNVTLLIDEEPSV
jgi:hypothetical protein